MKKYLAVARISFANILTYRWDYIFGHLRTSLLLVALYFLWTNAFGQRFNIFGFNKQEIISYIFLAAILRMFILTSAADQIAGELQIWGKFFSYLLRPIGYFRYWLTVDWVYKISNLLVTGLIALFFLKIFQVEILLNQDMLHYILFVIAVLVASLINFYISILVSSTGFWTSQVWGLQFLTVFIFEFTAGVYFPIDVLPQTLQTIIKITPFPYTMYYPISIFLGKLTLAQSVQAIIIAFFWLAAIFTVTRLIWQKGVKSYEAWGG